MASPIDVLLARARLAEAPYTQDDIDAAAGRIAARVTAHIHRDSRASAAEDSPGQQPIPGDGGTHAAGARGADAAAQDLRTLCETVVTSTDALTHLRLFISRSLPEPPGARVLGCFLQLTACEDSARSWWQYAAGAGDPAASYCLYLQHLAVGERGEADWWHTQADLTPTALDEEATEQEVSTTLRILSALKATGATEVPEPVSAVLDYVPVAVGFVDDDLDLPLPDPDFTERIQALTTATSGASTQHHHHPAAPLPERKPAR